MDSKKAQLGATVSTVVLIIIVIGLIVYFVWFFDWNFNNAEINIINAPSMAVVNQSFAVSWAVNGSGNLNETRVLFNLGDSGVSQDNFNYSSKTFCETGCTIPANFTDDISLPESGIYYFEAFAQANNGTISSDIWMINVTSTGATPPTNETNVTNMS